MVQDQFIGYSAVLSSMSSSWVLLPRKKVWTTSLASKPSDKAATTPVLAHGQEVVLDNARSLARSNRACQSAPCCHAWCTLHSLRRRLHAALELKHLPPWNQKYPSARLWPQGRGKRVSKMARRSVVRLAPQPPKRAREHYLRKCKARAAADGAGTASLGLPTQT